MLLPPADDDWVAVTAEPLPMADLPGWAALARCGAVVVFAGTVRDHSEGRPHVSSLEYEAYREGADRALKAIGAELRKRWPDAGRLALLHRTGRMEPTDVAVAVAVSMPHRAEAFKAASFAIDTLKGTVPIWKREVWEGGEAWGLDEHYIGPHPAPDSGPTGRHDGVPGHAEPVRKLRSVGA